MPLKHTTETFLIFSLGVIIALSGLVVAILPSLPAGVLLWGVSLAAAVVYPLTLGPLFHRRRADNLFRLLHWFPALIVVLAGGLQLLAQYVPSARPLVQTYEWGWTLPAVTVGFLLILAFCFRVLRRRGSRMLLLLFAFVPFAVGGVLSQQKYHWDQELSALLWQGDWWGVLDADNLLADRTSTGTGARSDDKNLAHSEDPEEESWRERLRAIEQRRERIAERFRARQESGDGNISFAVSSSSSSSRESVVVGQMSSMPSQLPSSGFGWGGAGLLLLAGYSGVLHKRAKKRQS
jgi:hypothetical protein